MNAIHRIALRACAAGALAFAAAFPAAGAPPAGTVITNQAASTATVAGLPATSSSNVVVLTTSAAPLPSTSATLVSPSMKQVPPGGKALFPHTLTNGSTAGSFNLSLAYAGGLFNFTSLEILPDANGDGVPDSNVPVAGPIALAPGATFRFVVRASTPAGVRTSSTARLSVIAQSTAPGGVTLTNVDTVQVYLVGVPQDLVTIYKGFSVGQGPSPYDGLLVTIRYGNTSTARSDFRIVDAIPPGFTYVPGSARWSATGDTPLTDAAGGDPAGIDYDFGVTQAGAVHARIAMLAPDETGTLTFRLNVVPGRPIGEVLVNVAQGRWTDPSGNDSLWHDSSPAEYRVTGSVDLTLTGDRVAQAMPGDTVTFRNVLTNRGSIAERFDISLGASTFPPGTPFTLLQSDGTTPLADTDGNGTPDTGLVAPGASYTIVVRARVPETTPPGAYQVTKTARSATVPSRAASADDVLGSVGKRCRVELTPDNQSQSAYGRHVTYAHYLENRGNCEEPVRVVVGFLGDSRPGWVSAAYVDNPRAGGASVPGMIDATDAPIVEGWTALLAPGQGLRILVDVFAPPGPVAAASTTKTTVETNLTTLTIESATGGSLRVTDRTTIDDQDSSIVPEGVIRNFTDPSYRVSTVWGVLGGTAWLRADARACNADPAVAETRVVVVTGANGEREEFVATETGPDTGVFVVPAAPIRAPPVVAGDRVLQGAAFDVLDAEVLGCGRRIATTITLTAPAGIVFDSASNEPVAGAVVTLVPASGGRCSATPVSLDGNPATTGPDGRYAFPAAAAGEYCVSVRVPNGYVAPSKVPYGQLVPGRNLVVTGPTSGGSYGQPFQSGGNGIVVDVPVDPTAQSGLFVQKAASRAVVDLGGFVDYVVRVRNGTGNALNRASVQLVDDLPAGFAYVSGSARVAAGALP